MSTKLIGLPQVLSKPIEPDELGWSIGSSLRNYTKSGFNICRVSTNPTNTRVLFDYPESGPPRLESLNYLPTQSRDYIGNLFERQHLARHHIRGHHFPRGPRNIAILFVAEAATMGSQSGKYRAARHEPELLNLSHRTIPVLSELQTISE